MIGVYEVSTTAVSPAPSFWSEKKNIVSATVIPTTPEAKRSAQSAIATPGVKSMPATAKVAGRSTTPIAPLNAFSARGGIDSPASLNRITAIPQNRAAPTDRISPMWGTLAMAHLCTPPDSFQ
jgi:hypothetical protein